MADRAPFAHPLVIFGDSELMGAHELFAVFIPSRGDIPPVSLTTARGAISHCEALRELGHTDADYYRYTCEHSDGWDH
jgi:hypothetical protein